MLLGHREQIQGIEGRLEGLYDIARLLAERKVPPQFSFHSGVMERTQAAMR